MTANTPFHKNNLHDHSFSRKITISTTKVYAENAIIFVITTNLLFDIFVFFICREFVWEDDHRFINSRGTIPV